MKTDTRLETLKIAAVIIGTVALCTGLCFLKSLVPDRKPPIDMYRGLEGQ